MTLAKTMTSISFCPSGKAVPVNTEIQSPSARQVLIRVAAAGINRPDIMQRSGHYPPPPGASDTPGLEISGEIVAIGEQVSEWQVGNQVCTLVTGGGYAQYCVAEASLCLPVPSTLSMIEAAGLPETLFTVWSNLFDRAGLTAGESLLVHGGSSGIGTIAIQLADAFGINVYVTAGSDKKCRVCEQLGADKAINYRSQDFVAEISTLTDQRGVDVILDMIGGDYLGRNLKCLADEGRLAQIAIQAGAKSELNLWTVMSKRLTITGSTLRARPTEFKAAIARSLLQQVWPLLESGRIKPVIDRCFPLAAVDDAHQLMQSSQHIGKIMLTIDHL